MDNPTTPRERHASGPMRPLDAQLDLDGRAHEIAPQTERMRLFEPAPAQLPGQESLGDLGRERND